MFVPACISEREPWSIFKTESVEALSMIGLRVILRLRLFFVFVLYGEVM